MKSLELLFLIIITAYILGLKIAHRGVNTTNKGENVFFCVSYMVMTLMTLFSLKQQGKHP